MRSGPSTRMARATPSNSSVPEYQSSDKAEAKDDVVKEEVEKGLESLKGATGGEASALVDRDGPTVASSAYLTRVAAGSLGNTGGNDLKSRQDVGNEVSLVHSYFASC